VGVLAPNFAFLAKIF